MLYVVSSTKCHNDNENIHLTFDHSDWLALWCARRMKLVVPRLRSFFIYFEYSNYCCWHISRSMISG